VIVGRGTVVVGTIERGSIRAGDAVTLVHGRVETPTKCLGVELFHSRTRDGQTSHALGLLLEGVERFDPSPGDYVAAR
jgi:elongation factor Tu